MANQKKKIIKQLTEGMKHAGSALRGKVSQLDGLRNELAISNADTSSVSVAITEYLTKSESVKSDLIAKLNAATKRAVDLQSQVVEMQNAPSFQEWLADESIDIEATPMYRSLRNTAAEIEEIYASAASLEGELDAFIKDASVITNAQRKYDGMITSYKVSESSKVALGLGDIENEFYQAIGDLSAYASGDAYAVGAVLAAIGIAMVAAALAIAFPPAGVLALGLLVGGGVSLVAGVSTLFGKAYVDSKNSFLKIGNAMLDEEQSVRAVFG